MDNGEESITTIAVQERILKNMIGEQGGTVSDLPLLQPMPDQVTDSHRSSSGQNKTTPPSTNPNAETTIAARLKANVTEIEYRDDLSDDEKVKRITHIACAACAGIAVQPIPFADIFILTPTQAYFGSRIGAIRGVPVSESSTGRPDPGTSRGGWAGCNRTAAGTRDMENDHFRRGWLVTIPLVYALTFAIMKVIDAYMIAKSQRKTLSNAQLKTIFKSALKEGKRQSKNREE